MTHELMCPCNNADERGCFLISAETGKCISCVCGDKMGAYLDGYAAGVLAARNAVATAPRHYWVGWAIEVDVALAAIDGLMEEKS